jgi:hypothetical protein
MHPDMLKEIGNAHRQDMLRSAETWRLAHPERRTRRSLHWWSNLRIRRQIGSPTLRPAARPAAADVLPS